MIRGYIISVETLTGGHGYVCHIDRHGKPVAWCTEIDDAMVFTTLDNVWHSLSRVPYLFERYFPVAEVLS